MRLAHGVLDEEVWHVIADMGITCLDEPLKGGRIHAVLQPFRPHAG